MKATLNAIDFSKYECIRRKETAQGTVTNNYYLKNTSFLMKLFGAFGKVGSSSWDVDGNQTVDTTDLLAWFSGWRNVYDSPELNPENWILGQNFGESVTELSSEDASYVFGFLHRTPYDEVSGTYYGFDLNSFQVTMITPDNIQVQLTFIRR